MAKLPPWWTGDERRRAYIIVTAGICKAAPFCIVAAALGKHRIKPPPWTGDDENMCAFIHAELDDLDFAKFRELQPLLSGTPEQRFLPSKHVLAGWRNWRENLAVELEDLETLRQLNPKLARFISLPPSPGRRKKRDQYFPLSPECRLELAIADVRRIRAIWRKYYRRNNRPRGEVTAEKIAAHRYGLTEDDVRGQRVSLQTRQRLASGRKTFPGKFGIIAG